MQSEYPPVWFSHVEYWAQIYRPNLKCQLLCILSLPPKIVQPNYRACIEEPPVNTNKKANSSSFWNNQSIAIKSEKQERQWQKIHMLIEKSVIRHVSFLAFVIFNKDIVSVFNRLVRRIEGLCFRGRQYNFDMWRKHTLNPQFNYYCLAYSHHGAYMTHEVIKTFNCH